jgi:hypothetical protein
MLNSTEWFGSPIDLDCGTAKDVSLLRNGALNVYAFLPCPLRVRFRAGFAGFLHQNRAGLQREIHCPNIVEGKADALTASLRQAETVEQLPDIIVTNNLGAVLGEIFRRRFIESGLLTGLADPSQRAALPGELANAARDYNLGFLAFGGWSVIADLSFDGNLPSPRSWTDLASPAFRNLLAAPGHDGEFCAPNVLRLLRERLGAAGLRAFAGNVRSVRHFSQIVKMIDSGREERAPFNLLPHAISAQIPTRKRARRLAFVDGPVLMPVLLFVRTDRISEVRPVLDYFHGPDFASVLAVGDFLRPAAFDFTTGYSFPNWREMMTTDYSAEVEALTAEFFAHFRGLPLAAE